MDKIDQRLVAHLATDARVSVAELAKRLDMARSTVQSRIERLERNGLIAGYTVRLGTAATKARICATVLIQLDPRATASVLSRLKNLEQVERAHTASGRFDMILTVYAADPPELDETLDLIGRIDGVRATESLIQLSTKIDRAPA